MLTIKYLTLIAVVSLPGLATAANTIMFCKGPSVPDDAMDRPDCFHIDNMPMRKCKKIMDGWGMKGGTWKVWEGDSGCFLAKNDKCDVPDGQRGAIWYYQNDLVEDFTHVSCQ